VKDVKEVNYDYEIDP